MARFRQQPIILIVFCVLALGKCDYKGNMFLNGQYQNGVKEIRETHFSVNPTSNVFLQHAIISRQASPFQGPTYLPPKEYLKCAQGQQCVRQGQCSNGFFSQQVPRIQVSVIPRIPFLRKLCGLFVCPENIVYCIMLDLYGFYP